MRTSSVGSAVIGRAVQEVYLASQQQTKPSAMATLVSARTRAAAKKSSRSRTIRSRAISIQSPPGVTGVIPQKRTAASCSGVHWATAARTAASSDAQAGEP